MRRGFNANPSHGRSFDDVRGDRIHGGVHVHDDGAHDGGHDDHDRVHGDDDDGGEVYAYKF